MQRSVAAAACAALMTVNEPGLAAVPMRERSPPVARQDDAPGASRPARGEVELLGVVINQVEQPADVLALRLPGGSLAVPIDALTLWRVRLPDAGPLRHEGRDHVALDAIPGLQWRVDAISQTLVIVAASAAFVPSGFEALAQARPMQAASSIGGFANYDLYWQRDDAAAGGVAAQLAGGLVEAGFFNAAGNGRTSGIWRSGSGRARFTRLDSSWNVDLPASPSSLRLGDSIGVAGGWGRSVRFAGAQWATNFALQPGLVRFPMPAVRGEASVPSVVDLYVNSTLQMQGRVPPGAFDMPDVPVVTGQGQIRMVVRDLLGREHVVVQPYYVSPALLRPGLHDFAFEAGAIRRDYGLESQRYGRALISATDRVGVSAEFTREWRAELLRQQQTVGATGVWLLGQFATAHLAAAASRGRGGTGWLASGGVDRQAGQWSASLQGRMSSRDFVQLGQSGDVGAAPRASLSAALAASIGGAALGAILVRQSTWQGDRFNTFSVNFGRSVGALGQFGIFASRTTGSASGTTIGINLIHVLDASTSVSASSYRSRERAPEPGAGARDASQNVLQLQRSAPAGPGFGYRLQADSGAFDRAVADAVWQTEHAALSAGLAHAGGANSYRAGISGAVAWMPEGVFLSRRIEGSFAVVQIDDFSGVRVSVDNQVVARTDARGRAFVTGLRSFEDNRIGVEAADLPIDAQLERLQVAVAPGTGSGVSVVFPVQRLRVATLRLATLDGVPVPAGSRVRIDGEARDFPVGFDGKVFLSGLAERTRVRVEWGDQHCEALLAFPAQAQGDAVPELGTHSCH